MVTDCIAMKISDWLAKADIADSEFADRIGVSRQALSRYKAGARTPRPNVLARIREATNGRVTANDFVPSDPTEAA
jgi:transcriptional regulator with XRE-family HTH domain